MHLECGLSFTKSYNMCCLDCQRGFSKILLCQNSNNDFSSKTILELQDLFCTYKNYSTDCPFCNKKATTILQTRLLVGDKDDFNYPGTFYPTTMDKKGKFP